MSWNNPISRVTAAVALSVSAMLPVAALADAIVVRATGPSAAAYPRGKKLAESAQVRLQANDNLILVDARGTRILRGPGTFSASASSAPAAAPAPTLGALAQNANRRVRVGAVRSVPGVPSVRPNLWMVDVAKPGAVCVVDPVRVQLWRSDPDAKGSVMIAPLAATTTGPITVTWDAGQSSTAWPAALPVVDGARYRLSASGRPAIEIRLRVIAAPAETMPAASSALIAAGCTVQLDQLVDATLATPSR